MWWIFFLSRVTCSFKCDRKNCNQLSTPTIASLEVIYIMLCLWMHKGNWLAVMWPCKTMPQLLILTQLLLAESCLSLRPCFKARLLYSHATVSKNCVLLCHKLNHSVTCSVRCTLITSLKAITTVGHTCEQGPKERNLMLCYSCYCMKFQIIVKHHKVEIIIFCHVQKLHSRTSIHSSYLIFMIW